ncbi:MAG: O-antigen ligase family protein [Gemmatimonadetes bacterium]|nr:O-antigen ligase family protein [Gemmatimonadota bacterium]
MRSGVLALLSVVFWVLASTRIMTGLAVTALVVLLSAYVVIQFIRQRATSALAAMLYLATMQPAIREYGERLPYLGLEYATLVFVGAALWASRRQSGMGWGALLGVIYLVFEVAGFVQSQALIYARTVTVPTIAFVGCLAMAGRIKLNPALTARVARGFLLGSLSMGAIVAQIYLLGGGIQWLTGSNFGASGGMGPNHVSLMFALSAFAWVVASDRLPAVSRPFCWMLAAGFTYLMILTFSRGGSYLLALGLVIFTIARRPSMKSVILATVYAAGAVLAFRAAISTTSGAAIERFTSTKTARVDLVRQGLQMMADHPVAGVGTGNYYVVVAEDEYFGSTSGAHNELVRAGAEHGVPGAILYALMLLAIGVSAAAVKDNDTRALRLALFAMALGSLFYVGLKLVIQPLILVLCLTIVDWPQVVAPWKRASLRVAPR